ncbi:hypothetical protein DFH06DRAFT_1109636 [Mycena polygramma]|nr:hypothetical protein DFH06DRAFT_1109636 [Mycena polygramma]
MIPIDAIYDTRGVNYPPSEGDCIENLKYIGFYGATDIYSPACEAITRNCLAENGTSIWSHPACVAAATCQGTESVIILNQCQNPNVLPDEEIPNMAASIYGNMVGDCAVDRCLITQQNYIDLVYGQVTAAGVTEWPSSSQYVITHWWQPILAWTGTGDSTPYANFNDWLHWSES